MLESLGLWGGVASYGLGVVLLFRPGKRDRTMDPAPIWLQGLGVLLLSIAIVERWLISGQGPFMTMYEVLLSNAFSLGLISALIFFWVPAARQGLPVVLPFLCLLGLWALMETRDVVPLPNTFDSPWLWLHVLAGKLFLGTYLVATGLAGVLLVDQNLLRWGQHGFIQGRNQVEFLVWRFVAVAFVFDSFMLVAGAVWAHASWGRYWVWDPLETWAFITWLLIGILLHLRFTIKIPDWVGWLMLLAIFGIAFLTFFGVPFMSMAPHQGV